MAPGYVRPGADAPEGWGQAVIAPELRRAADEVATGSPETWGYGYADTQSIWRFDPSVPLAREAAQQLLEVLASHALDGRILLLGAGHRGGLHRIVAAVAGSRVTVDPDDTLLAALAEDHAAGDPPTSFVVGEAADPKTLEQVTAIASRVDALLLAAGPERDGLCHALAHYAPLVRPGGIVAFCDDSGSLPQHSIAHGPDRFALELQRDTLAPVGVTLHRIGGAHAIHYFVQAETTARAVAMLADRAQSDPTHDGPRCLGSAHGFDLHTWNDLCWAVPERDSQPLDLRQLHRGMPQAVLANEDPEALRDLLAAWVASRGELAAARDALREGDLARARARAARTLTESPDLSRRLLASLHHAPRSTEPLVDAGTLALLGDQPSLGAALLRKALDRDLLDPSLLSTLGQAYRLVLDSPQAAAALAARARAALHLRKVGETCHGQLQGHTLWKSPKLLARIHGVIQVGAHRGGLVSAWNALDITEQLYLEPNPEAFAELEAALRHAGNPRARALPLAATAQQGQAPLHIATDDAHASLRPTHPLAALGHDERHVRSTAVACASLDDLVADGTLDPGRYNLLFVDACGSELEILRGAAERVLPHVDTISVAVYLAPWFDGAPLPQEIQAWLRELRGGDGFALCSFEPSTDGRRGEAVFRRIRRRIQPAGETLT